MRLLFASFAMHFKCYSNEITFEMHRKGMSQRKVSFNQYTEWLTYKIYILKYFEILTD